MSFICISFWELLTEQSSTLLHRSIQKRNYTYLHFHEQCWFTFNFQVRIAATSWKVKCQLENCPGPLRKCKVFAGSSRISSFLCLSADMEHWKILPFYCMLLVTPSVYIFKSCNSTIIIIFKYMWIKTRTNNVHFSFELISF